MSYVVCIQGRRKGNYRFIMLPVLHILQNIYVQKNGVCYELNILFIQYILFILDVYKEDI